MKKIYLLLGFVIFTNLFLGCNFQHFNFRQSNTINNKVDYENKILDYDEVKNSLIRFHVIANSDSDEDQNLKLKVRDAVLDYLYPLMNKSKSLEETRQIINCNLKTVQNIASEVIKDNNYKYNAKVTFKRENFPQKEYGNIILPQGNYEAFQIIIGQGQGHNWWCVMFPPLCFVDESKAVVEYDKTEEMVKDNRKNNKEKEQKIENDNKIEYKFKILEIFKDL